MCQSVYGDPPCADPREFLCRKQQHRLADQGTRDTTSETPHRDLYPIRPSYCLDKPGVAAAVRANAVVQRHCKRNLAKPTLLATVGQPIEQALIVNGEVVQRLENMNVVES